MDFHIDPTASLADIQLACFMAAITALVELAKTTDKDHIKLRALTEVARLCNPSKPTLSPRRVGSPGFTPSPTPSSPAPTPPPHGTPSASAGPHAPAISHAASPSHGPKAAARTPRREVPDESPLAPDSAASARSANSAFSVPLNRQQRRFLARLEANERKRQHKQHIAA